MRTQRLVSTALLRGVAGCKATATPPPAGAGASGRAERRRFTAPGARSQAAAFLLNSAAAVVAALATAACAGSGSGSPSLGNAPTPPALPDVPANLMPRDKDGYVAITSHGGEHYLLLEMVIDPYLDERFGSMLDRDESLLKSDQFRLPDQSLYADRPQRIVTIGSERLCTATVGELHYLVPTDCKGTLGLIGARLSGCSGELAPVGRVDGARALPDEIRWRPLAAPAGPSYSLFTPAAIADPLHRRVATEWLADPEFQSARRGTNATAVTSRAAIAADGEWLEVFDASAIAGPWAMDEYGECLPAHQRSIAATYLRDGDRVTPLSFDSGGDDLALGGLLAMYVGDGVLSWRGRIVALVAGEDIFGPGIWTIERDLPGRATATSRFFFRRWISDESCVRHDGPDDCAQCDTP